MSSTGRSALLVPSIALVISFVVVLGAGIVMARPSSTVQPTIVVTVDGAPALAGLPLDIRDASHVVTRGGLDQRGRYAADAALAGQRVCLRPPVGYAVSDPGAAVVGDGQPESCLPLSPAPVFHLTPGITVHVPTPAFTGGVVEIRDTNGGATDTSQLGSNGSVVLPDPAGRPLCLRPPLGWTVLTPVAAHGGIACAVFDGPYATFTVGEGSSQ